MYVPKHFQEDELAVLQALMSERPVIAAGCSTPIRASNVGATSASTPPEGTSSPGTVTTTGTGFSE